MPGGGAATGHQSRWGQVLADPKNTRAKNGASTVSLTKKESGLEHLRDPDHLKQVKLCLLLLVVARSVLIHVPHNSPPSQDLIS